MEPREIFRKCASLLRCQNDPDIILQKIVDLIDDTEQKRNELARLNMRLEGD